MVSTAAVRASSVTSNYSSSYSTDKYSTDKNSTHTKNAAPSNMVANPISWKYGAAIGAVVAGSFVLGVGL